MSLPGSSEARGQMPVLPVQPDSALAAIVGTMPLPRSELTKLVWDYIKANGLQDRKKRTLIHADAKLLPIFNGRESVTMLEMTKCISSHVS